MKKLLISSVLFLAVISAKSQVSIGLDASVPNEDAILDLQAQNKGFLLPRVKLISSDKPSPLKNHVEGMTVYNTAISGSGATYVSPGLYYNDGTSWIRLPLGYTNWFYMPSIPFKTSDNATAQTKDLYAEYTKQFGGTSGNFAKSASAPATIPYLPTATDLYYYVTDYDPEVFSNISISNNGVMTYDVKAAATDYTFINIVFVLK